MTAVGASVARPLDHRKREPGSFFKERGEIIMIITNSRMGQMPVAEQVVHSIRCTVRHQGFFCGGRKRGLVSMASGWHLGRTVNLSTVTAQLGGSGERGKCASCALD